MTRPTILGLATGTPKYCYNQMEVHDRWLSPFINSHRARAIYAAAEIEARYSFLDDLTFLGTNPSSKIRNDIYMVGARPLAAEVIGCALANAGLASTDLDHFIVTSCTGFDNPGLDVLLAADLRMRPDLRRSALIGMGCYAGLTGLDRAMAEVALRPDSRVLLLTVESGSVHFQCGSQLDSMMAGALFGDGLAAVIVGTAEATPHLLDTMTYTDYASLDLIGVHPSDHGYQLRLATRVPKRLREIVPGQVANFLARSRLTKDDVRFWGIHPGGTKIIDFLEVSLSLAPEQTGYSRQILRRYGNMSSATIFFVLEEIVRQGQPQASDYGLLLAFGPGLTIEFCLIQW
jgi:predicted naringenin-chalcone synthase